MKSGVHKKVNFIHINKWEVLVRSGGLEKINKWGAFIWHLNIVAWSVMMSFLVSRLSVPSMCMMLLLLLLCAHAF